MDWAEHLLPKQHSGLKSLTNFKPSCEYSVIMP